MHIPGLGIYLAVISLRRAHEVPRLSKLIGAATWYVGQDETADYAMRGALATVPTTGLVQARNQALEDAFALGLPCLQVSDDLMAMRYAYVTQDNRTYAKPVRLPFVVQHMFQARTEYPDHKLVGIAPSDSRLAVKTLPRLSHMAFIVGDMCLTWPNPVRYDPALALKEDYDYTCQHIARYGGVVRCNDLLMRFLHKGNDGGAVSYRNSDLEQEAIQHLRQKWPDAIRLNTQRPDEVILIWPRAPKSAQSAVA